MEKIIAARATDA